MPQWYRGPGERILSLTSLFTGQMKPQNTEEGLCHSTRKPWDTPLATTFFDLLLYTTSFDLLFYLSLLRLSKSPSEGRGYILAMVGHMAITHSPLILNMLAVTQRGEGISFTKADVCQVNDSWWQLMTSDRQFWSGKEIQKFLFEVFCRATQSRSWEYFNWYETRNLGRKEKVKINKYLSMLFLLFTVIGKSYILVTFLIGSDTFIK